MASDASGSALTRAAVVALDASDPETTRPATDALDRGAPAVVVGTDAGATGAVARALRGDERAGPRRVAVFVGDATADADAIAEFAAELFPPS